MVVATRKRAALGFVVHTGRAVVVAIGGPVVAPEVLAKGHLQVAFTFEEGAVFHAGQEMPVGRARQHVREAEARFTAKARVELSAFAAALAGAAEIVGAGMVAPPEKTLPPLETILKAHPLVHAAEGELYRRVFGEAAAVLGVRPVRLPGATLARATADALGLTPARIASEIAAMGKSSGKPWAADQKNAALVAWLVLGGGARAR